MSTLAGSWGDLRQKWWWEQLQYSMFECMFECVLLAGMVANVFFVTLYE